MICSLQRPTLTLARLFPATLVSLMLLVALPARAGVIIDFEDVNPADSFVVGDSFVTGGFNVEVQEFIFGDGTGCLSLPACGQAEATTLSSIGSGQDMFPSNVLLDFDLGPIAGLSLEFEDGGGNSNLRINGTLLNSGTGDFSSFAGASVGSINVAIVGSTMTLSGGLITDFAIGGQELLIDDIATPMDVPEAPTLVLAGLALLTLSGLRRRAARRG